MIPFDVVTGRDDSYNRSLLKMYVVAYETSSKTGNFY